LEQSVHAIDIPPRPFILDRITEEMDQDEPDLTALGHLISADVALSAGLIKTANSPFFGRGGRVRSVHAALLMLGLDTTCRAVASIGLRQAFPNSSYYERFWDASAKIAALSGWLANRVPVQGLRAEDAYTYGLFRDCGIVILMRRFPDYSKTLALSNHDAEASFTALELQRHPTDHTVVGSMLAQNWWLPDVICQAIRNHHATEYIERQDSNVTIASGQLIALSQTAEYLLQFLTGASYTQEWPKLGVACLRRLNLTEDDLPRLTQEALAVMTQLD
jgi:HD-like signal output (HDOD) protein